MVSKSTKSVEYAIMDLPYDIKEHISNYMDRASMSQVASVDSDFRRLMWIRMKSTFRHDFIHASKIFKTLQRMQTLNISFNDMIELGDYGIMSLVLDREVKEGEFFDNDAEFNVLLTMRDTTGKNTSFDDIVNRYGFHNTDITILV